MNIALVVAGAMPIPPRDWGAIEGTIWFRKIHLEWLGHTVDIFNNIKVRLRCRDQGLRADIDEFRDHYR